MSWSVSLMKFSKDISHIEEANVEDMLPLGTKAEILALLMKWFPEADFHDPSWISVAGGEVSEISLSDADAEDNVLVDSISFRNPSYRLLRDICAKMNWKAFDASEGDFIDFALLPSKYFSSLFFTGNEMPKACAMVDFVVFLRNQVLDTWKRRNRSDLRGLAFTLRTLGRSFSVSGDSTYWAIVDKLAYFAEYPELADHDLYVPTEEAIRALQFKAN